MATSERVVSLPVAMVSTRRWVIVGLLCLGVIIAYIDRVNLSVTIIDPGFKAELSLTTRERGLVNSAFFWSYAALQIPAGWLVDRFGSKVPYAISFFAWSLLSATTALTTGFWSLFLVRLGLGVGEAVMHPASMRWIKFNFDEKNVALPSGSSWPDQSMSGDGTLLAASLIQAYGWRAMFVISASEPSCGCPWLALVNDNRLPHERREERNAESDIPFAGCSPVRSCGARSSDFCTVLRVFLPDLDAGVPQRSPEASLGFEQSLHDVRFAAGNGGHHCRLDGRPLDSARSRPGHGPQGLYDCGLCHGLHRDDWRVRRFTASRALLRGVFTERPRIGDTELLGAHADPHSRRFHRQDRGNPELRRQPARHRRADPHAWLVERTGGYAAPMQAHLVLSGRWALRRTSCSCESTRGAVA